MTDSDDDMLMGTDADEFDGPDPVSDDPEDDDEVIEPDAEPDDALDDEGVTEHEDEGEG